VALPATSLAVTGAPKLVLGGFFCQFLSFWASFEGSFSEKHLTLARVRLSALQSQVDPTPVGLIRGKGGDIQIEHAGLLRTFHKCGRQLIRLQIEVHGLDNQFAVTTSLSHPQFILLGGVDLRRQVNAQLRRVTMELIGCPSVYNSPCR